ncbi:hypothetical protein ACLOJK_023851 [Asimina triloba]
MGGTEISIEENMGACDDGTGDWVLEMESKVENDEKLRETERGAWKKHSIYKLPKGFLWDERRVQAYKPQVVSLGPYHHGEEQVLAMEEHKLRALRRLLVRSKKSVKEYREALKQGVVLQQLMDSYKDLDKAWREHEERFLKLMILDGCFMMEVMEVLRSMSQQQEQGAGYEYDANDPIFSYQGLLSNLPRIKRDMLMLENQIPLLVLHRLYAVQKGLIHEQDKQKQLNLNLEVNNMVLQFFEQEKTQTMPSLKHRLLKRAQQSFARRGSKQTSAVGTNISTSTSTSSTTPQSSTTMTTTTTTTPTSTTTKQYPASASTTPQSSTTTTTMTTTTTKQYPVSQTNNTYHPAAASTDDHDVWDLHVLNVVRKSMIKDMRGERGRLGGGSNSYDVIWPATQLEEAGIQFRKSDGTSLEDIAFQKGLLRATLSLPQLLVDDATESKFLNLMAFEHLHPGSGKEVSSYVCFMDNIIDSDKDVSLLCKNDIIKNFVGTDQAVADLFNGISHDVSIDLASNLGTVHRNVTRYCNDPCNKQCANLKHGYFNTPWSAIAFVAASVALIITIIQFVYTFLTYYVHGD